MPSSWIIPTSTTTTALTGKCGIADKVRIKADTGVVISDGDRAQLGQAFTAMAGQLVAMGVPLSAAIKVAQKFVPGADLDGKTMEELGAGESEGMDESLWEQLNAGRDAGGVMGGGAAQ